MFSILAKVGMGIVKGVKAVAKGVKFVVKSTLKLGKFAYKTSKRMYRFGKAFAKNTKKLYRKVRSVSNRLRNRSSVGKHPILYNNLNGNIKVLEPTNKLSNAKASTKPVDILQTDKFKDLDKRRRS